MAEEKSFENKVKKYLESKGIFAIGTSQYKMPIEPIGYYEKRWGGGFSKAGLPDLHVVVNGINIDIELKATNGRLSELQQQKLKQIVASKSLAMVLYPQDFYRLEKLIEGVIECGTVIAELIAFLNVRTSIN